MVKNVHIKDFISVWKKTTISGNVVKDVYIKDFISFVMSGGKRQPLVLCMRSSSAMWSKMFKSRFSYLLSWVMVKDTYLVFWFTTCP